MEIGRDTVEIWWRYIRNPNDKAQMTKFKGVGDN
jgi:hypothetical protein